MNFEIRLLTAFTELLNNQPHLFKTSSGKELEALIWSLPNELGPLANAIALWCNSNPTIKNALMALIADQTISEKGLAGFFRTPEIKAESEGNLKEALLNSLHQSSSPEKPKSWELITGSPAGQLSEFNTRSPSVQLTDKSKHEKTFYFALEGDQTLGRQIVYGTKVDLVFSYGIPPSTSVVDIEGKDLEEARLSDDGELGISVIPMGLVYCNKDKPEWYKVAKFNKGEMLKDLRFNFCALNNPDELKNQTCGFNIRIDTRGLLVHAFFLKVKLVEDINENIEKEFERPIHLDLDSIKKRAENFESQFIKEVQYA